MNIETKKKLTERNKKKDWDEEKYINHERKTWQILQKKIKQY